MQNLRANLNQEELRYKDTNKGKYKWTPKAAGALHHPQGGPGELRQSLTAPVMKTAHSNELEQPITESTTWRTSVLPNDFDSFDFTPLEDDTRLLVHLSDEWVQHPLNCTPVELLSSTLDPVQKAIDKWWEEKAPHMHTTITPFVENHLRAAASADKGDLSDEQLKKECISGLHLLIKDGCKADEQCARAALVLTDPLNVCTAGKEYVAVRWGEKTQCIDYSAQTVHFGNLHYTAVDFGDVVMLANSTQKALRTPNREETNQCVLLHLAASGEWKGQGRPKRSPRKSRVDAFATHLRQYEYQQASAFVTKVKHPRTQREYELWSAAHDAMMANHDRQFREIPAFLTGIVNVGKCNVLRVFEIEDSPQGTSVVAHKFGEGENNKVNDDMALCVYNGHMRMLLPTAETTEGEWENWQTQVTTVYEYGWTSWETGMENDESLTTKHTLESCLKCGQAVRIPRHSCFNPVGSAPCEISPAVEGDWWNNWNPWLYQAPSNMVKQQMPYCNVGTNPPDYQGLGRLSPNGKRDLGVDFMPSSDHWWRIEGDIPPPALTYFSDLPEVFQPECLGELAKRGDQLVVTLKGLYPALCSLQEIALRQLAPQLSFASQYKHLIPDQFPWIFHTLTVGVVATYTVGVPTYPRTRGLPYQSNDDQHCLKIGEKFWKDILNGRMFVCTASSVSLHTPLEATPTTMVDKKNPDRTISLDKRMIADLRRVNLSFPDGQYYKVTVPTVSEVARDVLRLQALNPHTPIALTKRDIAAAFRLLRLHPALCLVMATELPGKIFGLDNGFDVVLVYLAMPFGWNGSPAHFAVFGDALTLIHRNFGMADPTWFGSHPFHSRLYVGDGIFSEVLRIQRMDACTECWERIAKGLLGPTAINLGKLDEEGIWKQII